MLRVDAAEVQVEVVGIPPRRNDEGIASEFLLRCMHGAGQTVEAWPLFLTWFAGCGAATGAVALGASSGGDIAPATAVVLHRVEPERIAKHLRELAEQTAAATPGRLAVQPGAAADGQLGISVSRITLTGDNQPDPLVRFGIALVAKVRPDRAAERAYAFSYTSPERRLSEWSEGAGVAVNDVLATVLPRFVDAVIDTAFPAYPMPHAGRPGEKEFTGLRAEYPPHAGEAVVEAQRPTFRWEAFPRSVDVAADPDHMAHVTNVAYELVIARDDGGTAGRTVYARTALPDNRHELEIELAPNTRYFWTVRARFALAGRTYVTPWAEGREANLASPFGTRRGSMAPSHLSYSFRTR